LGRCEMAAPGVEGADTKACNGAGSTAGLTSRRTANVVMFGAGRRCEGEGNWPSIVSHGAEARMKLLGCGRSEDLESLPTTHESIPRSLRRRPPWPRQLPRRLLYRLLR
jgi:hypothetical protein